MGTDKADTILCLGGSGQLLMYVEYLLKSSVARPVVVTSPRQAEELVPDGRTFRAAIAACGAPLHEVERFDVATVRSICADPARAIAVSMGAAWIFRKEVLDLLGGRVYNLHGTRLPQNRGGGTYSWQIMRRNRFGSALLHRVDEGVDTGGVIAYREFIYDNCRTAAQFQARCFAETLELLKGCTDGLLTGSLPASGSQPEYLSSYWPRLNTDIHGWVDWTWSGEDIASFIDAFDEPFRGARTVLGQRPVRLKACAFDTSDGDFHPFQAGIIYRVASNHVAIATRTGTVIVRQLLTDEGEEIGFDSIEVGDRLFTPAERLQEAMSSRVFYTAKGLREPR